MIVSKDIGARMNQYIEKRGGCYLSQEQKKCACRGGNLDRFIQPIILLILLDGPETGYGVFKRVGEFSMFGDRGPDATGIYRYLRLMEERGLLAQFEYKEAENKYKMKYRITVEGEDCLSNWKQTLSQYAAAIMELVGKMEEHRIPRKKGQ